MGVTLRARELAVVALSLAVSASCLGVQPAPAPTSPEAPPSPSSLTTRRIVVSRLNQLASDEGAYGLVFDPSEGRAIVVTYSGVDSVTMVSPDGDKALARYVLSDVPEFGTLISDVVLSGRTLFLNRTRLNEIALFDVNSGKTVARLSATALGVASVGRLVAGASGHVFVVASGPLPAAPPVIADTFVLELDQTGSVLRRVSVPRGSVAAYPAHAGGAAFDAASGSLFLGVLSDTVGVGSVAVVEPSAVAARIIFRPADGARVVGVDGGQRGVYVVSGPERQTKVQLWDLRTGALVRSSIFAGELASPVFDERSRLLFAIAPLRWGDADELLVMDPQSLTILGRAETPWDPYAHGLALDPVRGRMYVSSRVRPASVTTLSISQAP